MCCYHRCLVAINAAVLTKSRAPSPYRLGGQHRSGAWPDISEIASSLVVTPVSTPKVSCLWYQIAKLAVVAWLSGDSAKKTWNIHANLFDEASNTKPEAVSVNYRILALWYLNSPIQKIDISVEPRAAVSEHFKSHPNADWTCVMFSEGADACGRKRVKHCTSVTPRTWKQFMFRYKKGRPVFYTTSDCEW